MNINVETEVETVDRAYGELAKALMAAQLAAEWQAQAKCDLDTARASALASALAAGEVDGKNESVREALLRKKLAAHYTMLAGAEKRVRETRHAAELAQLEVERIRLRVRLMELAAGRERLAA